MCARQQALSPIQGAALHMRQSPMSLEGHINRLYHCGLLVRFFHVLTFAAPPSLSPFVDRLSQLCSESVGHLRHRTSPGFDHFPNTLRGQRQFARLDPNALRALATAFATMPPAEMMPPSPAPLAPSGTFLRSILPGL